MDSKRKPKRKAVDYKQITVEKTENRRKTAEVPSDYESDEVGFGTSWCSNCLHFQNMFLGKLSYRNPRKCEFG